MNQWTLWGFLYGIGLVPTGSWTYRAGRPDRYRFDLGAFLFASLCALTWFLAAPYGLLQRKASR